MYEIAIHPNLVALQLCSACDRKLRLRMRFQPAVAEVISLKMSPQECRLSINYQQFGCIKLKCVIIIQRRAQRAFDGIYTMNPVVLTLSPQRWLDQGASDLQGVLKACWRLSSRKNFFDPSMFKKLTFAEL